MEIRSFQDMVKEKVEQLKENSTIAQVETGSKELANTITYEEIRKSERANAIERFKKISVLSKNETDHRFKNAKTLTEKERTYAKSFYNFCKNFEKIKETGAGIYMVGEAGTGKTFYSNCIYNELKDNFVVYKTSLKKILDEKIDNFKNTDAKNDVLLKRLNIVDLLIIDDLGNEVLREWGKQEAYELFDYLYKNKISFIINTNLTDDQMEEFLNINGSSKILSRIKARCKPFSFNWEDRRKGEVKEIWEKYY